VVASTSGDKSVPEEFLLSVPSWHDSISREGVDAKLLNVSDVGICMGGSREPLLWEHEYLKHQSSVLMMRKFETIMVHTSHTHTKQNATFY
jgi:hypothetical protein